ncbi:MAG: coproporphyrinogen III oxidase family protein [Treponema sp.]|jgi:oxygen-independent coproporphyrinogen-3 oxidase|nr:coproporphyrinogen III oxidase family protein [Treponema sp.]
MIDFPYEAEASLYIHIPFCDSFCDYCNFYSIDAGGDSAGANRMDAYIGAIAADVTWQCEYFHIKKIPTAYIGGGTPSVLGARRTGLLLDGLNALPCFTPSEFTVEINVESATEEFLTVCRERGVNRISLGVQSFHEPSLRLVNRAALPGIMEERLGMVTRFYPEAFSADLITGLPLQTVNTVLEDVNRLLQYKPANVSLYGLSVESGTPLKQKVKTGAIVLPDRDEADGLWLAGRDALEKAGYGQYEVSNFALTGKRCLHNDRYWRMAGWLGAGPAASGTLVDEETGTAKRYTYPEDIDAYIKNPSIPAAVYEKINRDALLRESLLMGFRRVEGPDPLVFKRRFGADAESFIPHTIARWRTRGFFNGKLPTRDLMLFLNGFLSDAFKELDEHG